MEIKGTEREFLKNDNKRMINGTGKEKAIIITIIYIYMHIHIHIYVYTHVNKQVLITF